MAERSPLPTVAGRARRRLLVEEVRDLIAQEFLLNGAVPAGSLLPSEKDLAERYNISRVTLRASMRSLQEAGLIASRHGVGWSVLPGQGVVMQGLDRLSSLETFARETGKAIASGDLEWDEVEADDELAERLAVAAGHRVLSVRRTKLLDGVPVAYLLDFVPEGAVPFGTLREEFAGSVLDILLARPRLGVEYADAEIEPVNLPEDIAARLHVPAGSAALFMDSLAYAADGSVAEWAQSWFLPEHFRFRIRRRRQIGT